VDYTVHWMAADRLSACGRAEWGEGPGGGMGIDITVGPGPGDGGTFI
jgi:hypothetical protein